MNMFALACALLMAVVCASACSEEKGSQPAATSAAGRAQQIKRMLDEHREFSGGHSPVPRRVINKNSLDAVRPALDLRDANALVELSLDDAADVRGAAAYLLATVDSHADERLTARRSGELDKARRDRLDDALLEFKVMRAAPPPPASAADRRK